MRLILLGSPECVIPTFKILLSQAKALGHQVVGVVSQPSRRVGRGKKMADPPFAEFAKNAGLHCMQPEKASDPEFLKELEDLKPDIMITAAYGQILTQKFLDIPTRATINIHPSMLPKYRGATPVPAALWAGDNETGVSVLFTVKKLDAGNIIVQKKEKIGPTENAEQLMCRLFVTGGKSLLDALKLLEDPNFKGTVQDESLVTHCKKIEKTDALVDWNNPSAEIYNQFKALYPWPGSYSFIGEKRICFEHIEQSDEEVELESPGQFLFRKKDRKLFVKTKKGTILISELKAAGCKKTDAISFWNGLKNKEGAQFETIK